MTTGQLINGQSGVNDNLVATGNDDTVIGGSGHDVINGGSGNDRLFGDDTLVINARGSNWGLSTDIPNMQIRINGSVLSSDNVALMSSGGANYYVSADVLSAPDTVIDLMFTNDVRYYAGDSVVGDMDIYLNSISGAGVDLKLPFQFVNANGTTGYYAYDLSPAQNGGQIINFSSDGKGRVMYGGFVRFVVSTTAIAAGDDVLDGGVGADTMSGGGGNDTYFVDDAGDVVYESQGFGYDTVYSSVSWTMGNHVERLVLTGNQAINAVGNAQANLIEGNGLGNLLDGGAGADTLIGGAGNDIYVLDDQSDLVVEQAAEGVDLVRSSVSHALEDNVENLTLIGVGDINGTGNALHNVITGNTADNLLDGQLGADTLIGGDGNDTYVVNSDDDLVVEEADVDAQGQTHGSGIDHVKSSVSYTLGANVEKLTLLNGALNGTGNGADNTLQGNAANNLLRGLDGDDYLDGGTGDDTLEGGAGSDTYVIDSLADVIMEDASTAGVDTVQTSLSFTLAEGLENLQLTGNAILTGRGNDKANVLISNEGNTENGAGTCLYGMGGNDTLVSAMSYATDHQSLYGGAGDDFYEVNVNSGRPPRVVEYAGEGTDTIYFYGGDGNNATNGGTYVLPDNVENGIRSMIWMKATAVSTLVGNALGNTLTGSLNSDKLQGMAGNDTLLGGFGRDTLDGGTGNDLMVGGVGDDVYVVDSAGDVVQELKREGTDTVQSSISYTLGDNVERLQLIGSAHLSGTGNALNNVLTGNAGSNTLDGLGGADTLIGGDGSDTYMLNNASQRIVEAYSSYFYYSGGYDTVHMNFSGSYDFSAIYVEAIYADAGAVNVVGNSQDNYFRGSAGNDRFVLGAGDDYGWGSDGNDTLVSGAGYDVLDGGAGQDTYIVDMTQLGTAELYSYPTDGDQLLIQGVSDKSQLRFQRMESEWGEGDTHAYWHVGAGTAVMITAEGVAGSIVLDLFNADGSDRHALQTIQVGNSVLTFDEIKAALQPVSTDGNDLLFGFSTNDSLNGGAGDDWIVGVSGNDTLIGGSGADSVYGTGILDGGAGDDSLRGFGQLDGGAGNDYLDVNSWWGVAQQSSLIGGAGDDVLYSYVYTPAGQTRPGNWLDGGVGNDAISMSAFDTAVHRVGDGRDTVSGDARSVLRMEGTRLSDLLFAREYYSNKVVIANAQKTDGDRVTVNGDASGVPGVQIQVLNDDRTAYVTLSATTLASLSNVGNVLNNYLKASAGGSTLDGMGGDDTIDGGAGNDVLYGSAGRDLLRAGAGDNLLDGGDGNDSLYGGAGNDTLVGGAGADFFYGGGGADLFNGGAGADSYSLSSLSDAQVTILDVDGTAGNVDSVTFWSNPYATLFARNGNDLTVSTMGYAGKLTVKDWFLGSDHHIESIQSSGNSADGSTYYFATLQDTKVQSLVDAMASFTPPAGAGEITDLILRSQIEQAWAISAYSNSGD